MALIDKYHRDVKSLRKRINASDDLDLKSLKDTPKNREILYARTTTLVYSISKGLQNKYGNNQRLSWDDMIQNGNVGLLLSIEKWYADYDTNKVKWDEFYNFAYIWIFKYVMEYIDENLSVLSYGISDVKNVLEKTNTCDMEYENENGMNNIVDLYDSDDIDSHENECISDMISNLLSEKIPKNDCEILLHYFNIKGDMDRKSLSDVLGIKQNHLRVKVARLINTVKDSLNDDDKESYARLLRV